MLLVPPAGSDQALKDDLPCSTAYVSGVCEGMCKFLFIIKPAHGLWHPALASHGREPFGGRKLLPQWGSSEKHSLPPSAPQALFRSFGWEERTDGPALRCIRGYPEGTATLSHPLLPPHCYSLPGGHRLPSALPGHCFQQGILHEACLIISVAYSPAET